MKAIQFLSWETRGPAKPGTPDTMEQHGSTLYTTLQPQHINNFKKDLKELGRKDVNWTKLALKKDQWRVLTKL